MECPETLYSNVYVDVDGHQWSTELFEDELMIERLAEHMERYDPQVFRFRLNINPKNTDS